MNWLPSMDLNHDKQIQSLLCYRYTTRQARRTAKLGYPMNKSSILRGLVLPIAAALLALGSGCVKLNPSSELKVPATTALAAARTAARPAANGPVAVPARPGTF